MKKVITINLNKNEVDLLNSKANEINISFSRLITNIIKDYVTNNNLYNTFIDENYYSTINLFLSNDEYEFITKMSKELNIYKSQLICNLIDMYINNIDNIILFFKKYSNLKNKGKVLQLKKLKEINYIILTEKYDNKTIQQIIRAIINYYMNLSSEVIL